jgi:hypothetical protein
MREFVVPATESSDVKQQFPNSTSAFAHALVHVEKRDHRSEQIGRRVQVPTNSLPDYRISQLAGSLCPMKWVERAVPM